MEKTLLRCLAVIVLAGSLQACEHHDRSPADTGMLEAQVTLRIWPLLMSMPIMLPRSIGRGIWRLQPGPDTTSARTGILI